MVKTKILFSLIMIVLILVLVYYLTKKFELKKDQIIIFWILVLFWSAISIIRAYRKLYAITPVENGGLSLTPLFSFSNSCRIWFDEFNSKITYVYSE